MKTRAIISLWIFLAVICCQKETKEGEFKNINGLVVFTGEPAVDGCGWLLRVDTVFYSPDNLKASYKVDSLPVTVDFDTLPTRWICGFREKGYQDIKLTKLFVRYMSN